MRLFRTLALGASLLVLFGACTTGGSSKPTLKIGSVGTDEARLVAELYGQVLEANGYGVDRAGIGLGSRDVLLPALESGRIDLQPEYLGSGLAAGYGGTPANDPARNRADLQAILDGKGGGITVLDYTPAQDATSLVVRNETAARYGHNGDFGFEPLKTWGDLAPVATALKWGLATDCPTNPLCARALKDAYGIDTSGLDVTRLDACSTQMADALQHETVDVAELCSTSPEIAVNDWVRLADDKGTQPADNISPLVRNDYLAKVDKGSFEKLLNDLSAKIDASTLAQLDYDVIVKKKSIRDVASAWLKDVGLVR
jgi:osmoprotectant transport system substrate-binding protein